MAFLSGLITRFCMGFVKMFWQSHTDRELGKAQNQNDNLKKSNKELNRHAKIDSNGVSVNDAYADLGLSDGDEHGHSDSVPTVPESKPTGVVNPKGIGKP